jgi:hypothetical protein
VSKKLNSISVHSKIKEVEAREFTDFAVLVLKSDDLEIHIYVNNREEIQELLSIIEEAYKNIKVIKK